MQNVVSSNALKDKKRDWQRLVSEVFVPVDISIGRGEGHDFVGQFCRTTVANLDIVEMVTDPESATRTRQHVARDANPCFMFVLSGSGDLDISQYDRECRLRAESFTLIDSSAPYDFRHGARLHTLNVKIPKRLLGMRLVGADRFCAVARPVEPGLGKIATGLLRALLSEGPYLDATAAAAIENNVLDLLATLFVSHHSASAADGSVRWAIHGRCQAYIKAHLPDPGLAPETLAQAMGISVRYLHKVFEQSGQTFGEYLLGARLDRALSALSRPDAARLSIKQIAFGHGFRNPSHFSTCFRRRFGFSPLEARLSALQ
ncbi:MAG: transcriptional regulator, arac family [Bradyrhizobium sp.]|nr:transcriptional regulator, arac family [Bradyrhizobium sp.]